MLVFITAVPAAAQSIPPGGGFGLPLGCVPGTSCWVMNYPDVDATNRARDFQCADRTFQGHKGTDFAIRDRAAMRAGVPVIAAAAGTVRRIRDGVADGGAKGDRLSANSLACGNGAVIDHGGGWETQYCHLRRGSITVRPGRHVRRGAPIGMVGLSGRTQFPHVHLTIRRHGKVLDPFTGNGITAGCGKTGVPLWHTGSRPGYRPVALYAAGISPRSVTRLEIHENALPATRLPADAPALVLWIAMFGVRAGDMLRLRITGPDGAVLVDREKRIGRTQAWRMEYSGLRRRAAAWTPGRYRGFVELRRNTPDGRLEKTRNVSVVVR